MPEDDEEKGAVDPGALIAIRDEAALALADPPTLIEGLRLLQKRIPEFVQLTLRERRSRTRAAHLDPEFIDAGIQAAEVWEKTKLVLGRSGTELRHDYDEIHRWDEVEVEFAVIVKGIHDGNLNRKHRLGEHILVLYSILGTVIEDPEMNHLRPYYENMKRAYANRKRRKKSGKAAKKEQPDE